MPSEETSQKIWKTAIPAAAIATVIGGFLVMHNIDLTSGANAEPGATHQQSAPPSTSGDSTVGASVGSASASPTRQRVNVIEATPEPRSSDDSSTASAEQETTAERLTPTTVANVPSPTAVKKGQKTSSVLTPDPPAPQPEETSTPTATAAPQTPNEPGVVEQIEVIDTDYFDSGAWHTVAETLPAAASDTAEYTLNRFTVRQLGYGEVTQLSEEYLGSDLLQRNQREIVQEAVSASGHVAWAMAQAKFSPRAGHGQPQEHTVVVSVARNTAAGAATGMPVWVKRGPDRSHCFVVNLVDLRTGTQLLSTWSCPASN